MYAHLIDHHAPSLAPQDLSGAYFPYFNISDDAQWRIFAKKVCASCPEAG